MEVILLEDVKSLGKKGEVVKVNDGYARNFILPKKLGVEKTDKAMHELKLQKAAEAKRQQEILEEAPCNIVASKDGVIRKIISNKGSKVKEINDYVKKGDVLISGLIYKGDDISNIVHASGRVYAETWYTVNISVPYDYVEYMETGNYFNRYYISLFDKEFTISGKYEYKDGFRESYLIFEKPYLFFKLYKEINKEYKYISHKLSEREAYEIALKRSEEKIVNTLSSDEYVISKKVLKKEVKSSKIVLEVFFKVYEEIGETPNIENLGEINGSGNQRSN